MVSFISITMVTVYLHSNRTLTRTPGLLAGIVWRPLELDPGGTGNRYITEYQVGSVGSRSRREGGRMTKRNWKSRRVIGSGLREKGVMGNGGGAV